MGGRKQTRPKKTESAADHPFYISYPKAIPRTRTKQRKDTRLEHRIKYQSFPLPSDNLDILYAVEPGTAWQDMTSYKSFVLGGLKYKRDDFVAVANERTIKCPTKLDKSKGNRDGDEEWVARILEVRASDVNHVYARIQWMYRSYELPPSICSKEETQSQPCEARNELILSNHIDIIDVLSVSGPIEVDQWAKADHGEGKNTYFWRQAYDWRHCRLYTLDKI
jgi:hypothetical protein